MGLYLLVTAPQIPGALGTPQPGALGTPQPGASRHTTVFKLYKSTVWSKNKFETK